MENVDPDLPLELARQALRLPQTEDKEALRSTILSAIEAMNPLDQAAFHREHASDLKPDARLPGHRLFLHGARARLPDDLCWCG